MIVSHKLKTIFIHIQKTGGSSIEEILRQEDNTIGPHQYQGKRHIRAKEFKTLMGDEIWDTYFKFAIVRNPWDRLVSWYTMFQRKEKNDFARYIMEHYPDFESFIKYATDGQAERASWTQYDFLFDEKGNCLVDFIGHFENLENDFAHIASQLGIKKSLPHINATQHRHYRDYYTEETKAIIGARFQKDLEHFNYKF